MSYFVEFVAAGKAAAYAELTKQLAVCGASEETEIRAADDLIGMAIGNMPDGEPVSVSASGSAWPKGAAVKIEVRTVKFVVAQ